MANHRAMAQQASFYRSLPAYAIKVLEAQARDEERIGTLQYRGAAWFWHIDYKHDLRDATALERRRVHNAWVRAGLDVAGSSRTHRRILDAVMGA